MIIEDINKARHMAENEGPLRERGKEKPKEKAHFDRVADFQASETEIDNNAIGEAEYDQRKKAIAKILAETPMAVRYLMRDDPDEIYKWSKTSEGKQTIEQLEQFFTHAHSLRQFFIAKELVLQDKALKQKKE